MRRLTSLLAMTIVLCAGSIASAHPQLLLHSHGQGFEAGLIHPLMGIDHLLAMMMVGVLAASIGGRAMWLAPLTFVSGMVLGGFAGIAGTSLPGIEAAIAVSVILLGLAIATRVNLPNSLALAACATFGLVHGHAHGAEMPLIAQPVLYAAGFVLATAALHLSGILIQRFSVRTVARQSKLRFAGVVGAAVGLLLLLNVV